MAQASPSSPGNPDPALDAGILPAVQIELRHGAARPVSYPLTNGGFLIGTVPGCDLRLPGGQLPSVICLLIRQQARVLLRRLSPVQPILLNGQPVASATLADGDRVTIGAAELLVHVSPAVGSHSSSEEGGALAAREQQLRLQVQELEAERVIWSRRREEIEKECRQRQETAHLFLQQVRDKEAELEQREQLLHQQRTDQDARQEQVEGVRRELADLRQQWHARYQARRDRLAALHEAIRTAARKVQDRKREVDTQVEQAAVLQKEGDQRRAELDARADEMARLSGQLEQDRQILEDGRAEVAAREQKLAEDRQALEQGQAQYQDDLVRLDRQRAALEQREQQVEARGAELDQRLDQMQRDGRELEEQALQLDDWQIRLCAESDQLAQRKTEQETAAGQLNQRGATLEGQQAMLSSLRTRLERMREDVQRESQQLAEQRERLETAEADLDRRSQEAQRLRGEIESERQLHEQDRRHFEERHTVMERAVTQLRQVQDRLAEQEEQLKQREQTLNATAAEQAEQSALVRARLEQLSEQQHQIAADRQALRERETTLTQAEQTLASLQEQLRRRSEELNARQRAQAEQLQRHQEDAARIEERVSAFQSELAAHNTELSARQAEVDVSRAELDAHSADLSRREETWARQVKHLQAMGRRLGQHRKALGIRRAQAQAEQRAAAEALVQSRAHCEALRQQAAELEGQLPELELRAREVAERLSQAREQLREHLAEFHSYVGQSRDDLEALQTQVQAEAERVRLQELGLRRDRDEHRLAVAGFRQQLIEWQGQVGEMKQALARDETRLERRQAEVNKQVRQVDVTSARLAKQAEELQEQEREVVSRREEMTRHLEEMRQWYRHKLRELTGRDEQADPGPEPSAAPVPERDILSLTGEVDPGDRQLGELLRTLDLVDADTLNALLIEARKQRRSLRQALLAGGCLTLYQMALIEAGNLEALALGPVRVIDRLWANSHEAVYRVFDPRRGQEALLRHLAEAEMEDAVRPDEFRQRFAAAAAVSDPHLTAVLEVLEIAGRPAVLQEWLVGLPGAEWPALVGAPGVWYRLLSQAALGLRTAHLAGLVHGHLTPGHLLLMPEGILKLSGFGEPGWLAIPPPSDSSAADPAADLEALGRIAADWLETAAPRKSKNKPPPDALQTVLQRLTSANPEERYPGASELLEDLERARAELPTNATAWERLLRHVGEQLGKETELRESA